MYKVTTDLGPWPTVLPTLFVCLLDFPSVWEDDACPLQAAVSRFTYSYHTAQI